ncbi:hypothetical protein ACWCOV_40780 [Kribbella sp. NPDC002412]
MTIANIEDVVAARASLVARSLTRHRLVYLQIGAAFDPIRGEMFEKLHLEHVSAAGAIAAESPPTSSPAIAIEGLEELVHPRSTNPTMGALREEVLARVEAGQSVCLVSRAPRCAFGSIPGSSLLEDCALVALPLLNESESPGPHPNWSGGWRIPAISSSDSGNVPNVLRKILQELGNGTLAALDHALFEIDPKSVNGIRFLDNRDLEALRCCGLIAVSDRGWELTIPEHLKVLKEELAYLLSKSTTPPIELNAVVSGLWYAERTIRLAVRKAALDKWGDQWRASVLGGLASEALKRAQLDSSTAATKITELRDPLEWLTLGELLDIVRSEKFSNLGKDPLFWRKLQEQLVPIRNRLAHVRILKSTDEEVVTTWIAMIGNQIHLD